MPVGRDPFPFPKLQNDDNFVGRRNTQKKPFTENTATAQQRQPWNRLNRVPTLSSVRREVYCYDPQAPLDSLDFTIKSQYDQHDQLFKTNRETLLQRETTTEDHGRMLKNRIKEIPPPFDPLYPPLRETDIYKKENPSSIEGAIQSHHSAATNGGYSRRHDGGFYAT